MIHFRSKLAYAVVLMTGMTSTAFGQKGIDTARSGITVHVRKSGLLSIAGHEHWVSAPIAKGTLSSTGRLSVEFTVDAAQMRIQPEADVDASTQAEIQKDMLEISLQSANYPSIHFESSAIEDGGKGLWKVKGLLALHGVTKPLTVLVRQAGDVYSGQTTVRQTDFGIKPITAAGGMIKVKDELEIEFRIVARQE